MGKYVKARSSFLGVTEKNKNSISKKNVMNTVNSNKTSSYSSSLNNNNDAPFPTAGTSIEEENSKKADLEKKQKKSYENSFIKQTIYEKNLSDSDSNSDETENYQDNTNIENQRI